ncbi:MAG: Galactose-1-phosphate uridylyltransferase [Thermodesulfobacterium sp.]|uniref:Galactose-1-phosphate uridylyltransferase n=1 Tax=Candidatus Thermodesulfobacterium syntrophicum TaxID=3060442 RepID=A0AAE3TER7_9BACT|nr:Galactose-1-phosphate uridylyltransferase [Candidatus Thermodesulfobacterium syntrophicum]
MNIAKNIYNLPKFIENFLEEEKNLFNRIYTFYIKTGKLKVPDKIKPWIDKKFKNCEAQKIIRITNKITFESTLFNELRAKRPIDVKVSEDLNEIIEKSKKDPFCNPFEETPSDVFGRVEGRYCVTASNIAKYDYLHAVIIFKDHNPLTKDAEKIKDYLEVALKWFEKANKFDKKAVYPFFMWNCLWRAGASLIHGHAQILISEEPYGKQKFYTQIRETYKLSYGSEYFEDIYKIHKSLGLAFTYQKTKIVVHITPVKEKEIFLFSSDFLELAEPISLILKIYYQLGVRSFNLAIFMPPLNSEDIFFTRIVDRGDLSNRTSDIGGMELYAGTSVVATDPFVLAEEIKRFLK